MATVRSAWGMMVIMIMIIEAYLRVLNQRILRAVKEMNRDITS